MTPLRDTELVSSAAQDVAYLRASMVLGDDGAAHNLRTVLTWLRRYASAGGGLSR
jgi:hypothetical protein